MKPQDLMVIGVDPASIEEGDSIVAIGRKGGLLGKAFIKTSRKIRIKKSFY